MARSDFRPMFPIDLVEKDLSYLLHLAGDQAEMPMATGASGIYHRAGFAGFRADNITAVAHVFE
jgi:3-hydroxyisobutyrate dehydrogenase